MNVQYVKAHSAVSVIIHLRCVTANKLLVFKFEDLFTFISNSTKVRRTTNINSVQLRLVIPCLKLNPVFILH